MEMQTQTQKKTILELQDRLDRKPTDPDNSKN